MLDKIKNTNVFGSEKSSFSFSRGDYKRPACSSYRESIMFPVGQSARDKEWSINFYPYNREMIAIAETAEICYARNCIRYKSSDDLSL